MFSIRGLLFVTLFVACMTALGQYGTLRGGDEQHGIEILAASLLNLIAFWSILRWIHEVETIRSDHQYAVVLFVDVSAFAMFTCQLMMVGYVFGVMLSR